MAGPAIKKAKAAPGLKPAEIRATAIGMEPVAQTYIGMAIKVATTMPEIPEPRYC